MMRSTRTMLVALMATLAAPLVCRAQALADRLPDDALLYMGWSGTADLGPDYPHSHLKAILDQSEWPVLLHQSLPNLLAKLSAMNPIAAQAVDLLSAIGRPLLTHPSAFYIGKLDLSNANHPVPRVAIVCDAGDEAAAMAEKAKAALALAGPNLPVRIFVTSDGNLVVISTFPWVAQPPQPLSQDAQFRDAMTQVGGDAPAGQSPPIFVFYANGQKLWSNLDDLAVLSHDPQALAIWAHLRDALGLKGLNCLADADGFAGRDFVDRLFISAPPPRLGLAALLDEPPLGEALLQRIPVSATTLAVGQFDFGKLLDQVRRGVSLFSTAAAAQFDQFLQMADAMVGFNLRTDLLDAMGSQWAFYNAPDAIGGGAILNRVNNQAKLEASLDKLEQMANAGIAALLSANVPWLKVEFRQQQIDGLTVHFAALPAFTPAWTISDGVWYIGAYPQLVVAAAQAARSAQSPGGRSILDNPDFQELRKRLGGPADIAGLSFVDTPKLAPRGYVNLLLFSRLFLGAGDLVGLESPAMVVPPLSKIMPELEPEGGISWVDDAGLHGQALQAFPGDGLLAVDNNMAGAVIQMISAIATQAQQQLLRQQMQPPPQRPPGV
jgi:hypothetical protein